MLIKRKKYDSNNSLAVTVCLYSRDINHIQAVMPKAFSEIVEGRDMINILYALLMVANKLDRKVANAEANQNKTVETY